MWTEWKYPVGLIFWVKYIKGKCHFHSKFNPTGTNEISFCRFLKKILSLKVHFDTRAKDLRICWYLKCRTRIQFRSDVCDKKEKHLFYRITAIQTSRKRFYKLCMYTNVRAKWRRKTKHFKQHENNHGFDCSLITCIAPTTLKAFLDAACFCSRFVFPFRALYACDYFYK